MDYQIIIFCLFAFIATIAAVMVVTLNHPVRCVLSLVVAFFAVAVMWMLAYAEFLALVLVLVYVGAVMTLFLFVIMMLNIDIVSMKKHFARYLPIGLAIIALFVYIALTVIEPANFSSSHLQHASSYPADYSNTKALGAVLYTNFAYALELAAVILLIAIIAAISLAHRPGKKMKTQNPVKQIMTKRSTRVRIVKMAAEKEES